MNEMKKIFLLLFINIAAHAGAQVTDTAGNFKIIDDNVIWEKTFVTTKTFDQVVTAAKASGIFVSSEVSDKNIMGLLNEFTPDARKAGYKDITTPMYVTRYGYSCYAVLTINDSMCTAIIKKIQLVAKITTEIFGDKGDKNPIEPTIVTRNKKFASHFKNRAPEKILDYHFTRLFAFLRE